MTGNRHRNAAERKKQEREVQAQEKDDLPDLMEEFDRAAGVSDETEGEKGGGDDRGAGPKPGTGNSRKSSKNDRDRGR